MLKLLVLVVLFVSCVSPSPEPSPVPGPTPEPSTPTALTSGRAVFRVKGALKPPYATAKGFWFLTLYSGDKPSSRAPVFQIALRGDQPALCEDAVGAPLPNVAPCNRRINGQPAGLVGLVGGFDAAFADKNPDMSACSHYVNWHHRSPIGLETPDSFILTIEWDKTGLIYSTPGFSRRLTGLKPGVISFSNYVVGIPDPYIGGALKPWTAKPYVDVELLEWKPIGVQHPLASCP